MFCDVPERSLVFPDVLIGSERFSNVLRRGS